MTTEKPQDTAVPTGAASELSAELGVAEDCCLGMINTFGQAHSLECKTDENERLRALLRRGMQQLAAWQELYGWHNPEWLPPAGDVRWMEDVSEALETPTAEVTGLRGFMRSSG